MRGSIFTPMRMVIWCLGVTSGMSYGDVSGKPKKYLTAAEFGQSLERQYPALINISPAQGSMLLKSRIGSQFILSLRYPPYRETQQIASSTQTQLALTWHPRDMGIAWLEPVKVGCGFELRYLDLKSKNVSEFKSVTTNNASLPLRFSPDGRYVAFVGVGKLYVVDISKPEETPKEWFDGIQGPAEFVWSTNSEMIVVPNDGKGLIYGVTAHDKKKFLALEPGAELRNLSWSPESKKLLGSLRSPKEEYDSIVVLKNLSKDGPAKFPYETLIKQATGSGIRPQWLHGGMDFLFVSQEGERQRLLVKRNGVPSPQELASVLGEIEVLRVKGDRAAVLESTGTGLPEPREFELEPSKMRGQVNGSSQPIFFPHDEMKMDEPKTLSVTSKDGARFYLQHWQAQSWQDLQQAAVLWIHGGPHLRESVKWNAEIREMIAQGVDIVQVNYRGSTGYGRAFEVLGDDRSRLEDIEASLEYLGKERKIPAARVVLMGSSYGGYLAARYVHERHPDLKGLVLLSPGTLSSSDAEVKVSTVFDAFKYPLFVFQGQQDCVIPPAKGIRTIESLLGRNIPNMDTSVVKIFPDEGHHFHKTSSRAEVWAKVLEVLRRD